MLEAPTAINHQLVAMASVSPQTAATPNEIRAADLTAEHVLPQSRGGSNRWANLVSACRPCNHRKGNRTPEEAGMALLYVPYTPSLHEGFILRNRRILADQMAFLMAGVPPHSRLHGPNPASAGFVHARA